MLYWLLPASRLKQKLPRNAINGPSPFLYWKNTSWFDHQRHCFRRTMHHLIPLNTPHSLWRNSTWSKFYLSAIKGVLGRLAFLGIFLFDILLSYLSIQNHPLQSSCKKNASLSLLLLNLIGISATAPPTGLGCGPEHCHGKTDSY